MAVVNALLRGVFIGLNILYILLSLAVFIFAIVLQIKTEKQLQGVGRDIGVSNAVSVGVAQVWVFGIGILVVACLGIYGVKKEKNWPLTSFVTAHTIGLVMMIMAGATMASAKRLYNQLSRMHNLRMEWTQLDTQLAICFTFVASEIIAVILGGLIIHRLSQRSAESGKY